MIAYYKISTGTVTFSSNINMIEMKLIAMLVLATIVISTRGIQCFEINRIGLQSKGLHVWCVHVGLWNCFGFVGISRQS